MQLVSLTLILWMVKVIYSVDSAIGFPNTYPLDSDLSSGWCNWFSLTLILWILIYPVDRAIGFPNTYPLDSDLSSG